MIAVVGAAGKVGHATCAALRSAGVPVKAVLRDKTKSSSLHAMGCEVAVADLQDPLALRLAVMGADTVQIILPPSPGAPDAMADMRKSISSLVSALRLAAPQRVLAISDYGAHIPENIGMPTMFREFEDQLRQLDRPRLFLRSAEHMEGWGALVPIAAAKGILPSFHCPLEKVFPTISAADLGRLSASLMLQPTSWPHEQIVHAEGTRRLSANDVAAVLGELLGRSVVAQAIPRSQWQETLQRHVSASTAELLVKLYDAHNAGGLIDIEPNVGTVYKASTALNEVLRPFVDAFQRASA